MKCISFGKTFAKISCVAWSVGLAQILNAQNPTLTTQKENTKPESQSSVPEYIPQSALESTLESTLESALDSSSQDSKAQKDTDKDATKESTKEMTQREKESSSNSATKSSTQENTQSSPATSKNEKSEKKDEKDTNKFGNIFKSQKLDSTTKSDLQADLQNSQNPQISNQASTQSNESFITPQEYGASLYEYPRGIGCIKCHGAIGEETLLATYTHKGKQKTLLVPRINNLEILNFKTALNQDKGIMPKYNLTDEEIQAIYLYISSKNPTRIK